MTDIDDPTKFGIHDGYRVREYPNSGSSGFISGYSKLCDACSHEHRHGQASRHNTAPGTQCESRNHESNVLIANSGAEEPTEYEQYKDHPDVRGWAKDDFSGRDEDHVVCPSCAEDRRSSGLTMEPYRPLTERFLMPDDHCKECGHDLHSGRKEATMTTRPPLPEGLYFEGAHKEAISDEEFRRLTALPPLDVPFNRAGKCTNCGNTLGPGETGLCPDCDQGKGGGRKTRHRRKLVQTQGGGVERMAMLDVLDHIWRQGSIFRPHYNEPGRELDPIDRVQDKYENYRGTRNHVPIANNTWVHKDTDGNTHIRHHQTDIMSFSPEGHITVNPDGWHSATTMGRINTLLPQNMKLMRNPSKAQGGSYHVFAHNPSGGSIYPGGRWDEESGEYQRGPRAKYGLHPDTVLHPYHDGFSIHSGTGEVLPDDHVRPGTPARPPQARGTEDPGPPRPRPSRSYYDTGISYDPSFSPSGRPGISPVVHPYSPTPMHEQESTHEQIRRQLQEEDRYSSPGSDDYGGDRAPMGFSHHDMPAEGESFDDWMSRTTEAPKHVKCPTCKGKGDVRAKTPVPEGVNPWEHREECSHCGGGGIVKASLRKAANLGHDDLEMFSRWYLAGLQVLAYGEVKAPISVDTLRDDACPVCGENDAYDGDQCQVCGFVTPPKMFRDPDLDQAKLLDLRDNPATGAPNDQDPNVGTNLPPVDESQIGEEGDVEPGAEGEEAAEMQDDDDSEQGVVEAETRGLGDVGDTAEEEEGDEDQVEGPVDEDEVDEDGDVVGGPEDPEAASKHFDQGGEPFTQGPNAPVPGQPMEQGEQVEDGQVAEQESGGLPGTPGDQVADLLCPSCGFGADAAHPTSTPGNAMAPADEGDGLLAGDICPQCQQATMMSVGELDQMQEQMQGTVRT